VEKKGYKDFYLGIYRKTMEETKEENERLIESYLTGKERPVKFRYTFPLGTTISEESMPFINDLVNKFIDMLDFRYGSIGIENMDRFGDITHLHVHIHCITSKSIDSLRKAFKVIVDKYGEKRKGKEVYSCKPPGEDLRCMNRFLRYPFKQTRRGLGYFSSHPNLFPPEFNLEIQMECAIEEWERLIEVNRMKREKALNPNTFEKFETYMEDKTYKSLADIAGHIDEFYLVEKMSMNLSTMGGYIRTFARSKNIITKEQQVQKLLEFV